MRRLNGTKTDSLRLVYDFIAPVCICSYQLTCIISSLIINQMWLIDSFTKAQLVLHVYSETICGTH